MINIVNSRGKTVFTYRYNLKTFSSTQYKHECVWNTVNEFQYRKEVEKIRNIYSLSIYQYRRILFIYFDDETYALDRSNRTTGLCNVSKEKLGCIPLLLHRIIDLQTSNIGGFIDSIIGNIQKAKRRSASRREDLVLGVLATGTA